MEPIITAIGENLHDSLKYKLNPTANYVLDRRSVTFHPQGSDTYKPKGTRLIKLALTGDSWMDPATMRIQFDLHNSDPNTTLALPMGSPAYIPPRNLRPIGNPYSFFRRLRILCNGKIIEDIDDFNRISEMLNILSTPEQRRMVETEGFGANMNSLSPSSERPTNPITSYPGIKQGQKQTVSMKLGASGLFSQLKFIPLRYAPIVIELELVTDETDVVVSTLIPYEPLELTLAEIQSTFNINTVSSVWEIKNVQVKVDVCTIDSTLDNTYTAKFLAGTPMVINFQTYISQMQTLGAQNQGQQKIRVNVTRSLNRLKSVFVNFDKYIPNDERYVVKKSWNDFSSPMRAATAAGPNQYDDTKEMIGQVSIGSKNFPEFPLSGHSEFYSSLLKTVGYNVHPHNTVDISSSRFRSDRFIFATSCEKLSTAGYTGVNTRSGDIVSIRFDSLSPIQAEWPEVMQVVLCCDSLLEIFDGAVEVHA